MVDSIKGGDITASKYSNSKNNDKPISLIVVACDSGMGSSAMGASVLKKILKNQNYEDIVVENASTGSINKDADIVVTLSSLIDRAKISLESDKAIFVPLENFLKDTEYDEVIKIISERNKK